MDSLESKLKDEIKRKSFENYIPPKKSTIFSFKKTTIYKLAILSLGLSLGTYAVIKYFNTDQPITPVKTPLITEPIKIPIVEPVAQTELIQVPLPIKPQINPVPTAPVKQLPISTPPPTTPEYKTTLKPQNLDEKILLFNSNFSPPDYSHYYTASREESRMGGAFHQNMTYKEVRERVDDKISILVSYRYKQYRTSKPITSTEYRKGLREPDSLEYMAGLEIMDIYFLIHANAQSRSEGLSRAVYHAFAPGSDYYIEENTKIGMTPVEKSERLDGVEYIMKVIPRQVSFIPEEYDFHQNPPVRQYRFDSISLDVEVYSVTKK